MSRKGSRWIAAAFVVAGLGCVGAGLATTGPARVPLKPVRNVDLAAALCYQHELANTYEDEDAPFTVRVYEVVTGIDECGGAISTCPDVDLYVAVSERDLGSEPSLWRLPRAKGWKFVGWLSTCHGTPEEPKVGLAVRTTLPGVGHIDPDAVAGWRGSKYEMCVSPGTASYQESFFRLAR